MAKDRKGTRKKTPGFWRRGSDKLTPEESTGPEQTAPAPNTELPGERTQLPVGEGALLELWRRWYGAAAPMVLSLAGERPDLETYLGEGALEKEKLRLKLRLEQDAKNHLLALKQAEQRDEDVDSSCGVYLSENKMVAWIMLFPPSDPEMDLRFDRIGKAMQAVGITTGLDSVAVMRLFQEKAYLQLTPIAFGTPVVQGEDGQIIELRPRELESAIKIDENGVADYRSQNYVQLICQGDEIYEIIPPKEGRPGLRVDGKVVEPRQIQAKKVPKGRNTVLSEDGRHVVASSDGHLVFANGAFHVKPVLEISHDVDYSTGNIDFHGDVHIHGNVRENFSVRATGTVVIDGLVEAALIEAGGDLVIASGVLGDYKAVIRSRGNIRVKYLENCVAYADKSVYADCIMLSQIFSDDTIDVTGGRGTVIGGTLTAARLVKARLIGSQAGRRTKIVLGKLAVAEEKAGDSQTELEAVRREIREQDRELQRLVEQQGVAGDGGALAKAQLRKSVLAMKEMQLLKRFENLQHTPPDLSQCRLESGTIYPITQVEIGEARLTLQTIQHACRLRYDVETERIKM